MKWGVKQGHSEEGKGWTVHGFLRWPAGLRLKPHCRQPPEYDSYMGLMEFSIRV